MTLCRALVSRAAAAEAAAGRRSAYEERLQKGHGFLFELLRTCAAVINAAIALIRLIWDIAKEHKQKSNRRAKV